jgi:peroxiredoxin
LPTPSTLPRFHASTEERAHILLDEAGVVDVDDGHDLGWDSAVKHVGELLHVSDRVGSVRRITGMSQSASPMTWIRSAMSL